MMRATRGGAPAPARGRRAAAPASAGRLRGAPHRALRISTPITGSGVARRAAGPGLLLAVICVAQFMVILDVAVDNVALPSIRSALGFSTAGLQWVVNAYTLTFAGFLMLGGRASDLLGRRRVLSPGSRCSRCPRSSAR